jgi:hypothetical protein
MSGARALATMTFRTGASEMCVCACFDLFWQKLKDLPKEDFAG